MVCKIRKLNGLEQYGMEWDGWDSFPKHGVSHFYPLFGEGIFPFLLFFGWKKWFENSLKWFGKMIQNCLTLRISRRNKQLRFKDIVQGFEKLKKMVEKKQNGM